MTAVDYDIKDLLNEREWRKCAPDTDDPQRLLEAFEYFCATYVYIKHPDKGRINLNLFDSQRQSVDLWIRSRYSLMLKARQLGFSTLVTVYALWLTFFHRRQSRHHAVAAPSATPSNCWPKPSTPTASFPNG